MWRSLRTFVSAGFVMLSACDPETVTIAKRGGEATSVPRGRVEVIDGRLVSDRGTRLRGVSIEADLGIDFALYADPEAARPTLRSFFDRLTTEVGLNTFGINLEGWDVPPGSRAEFADVLVEESARAGAYLMLGPGSGPIRDGRGGTGWFDPDFVAAFWEFCAPRYAAETHVFYQLQKVPDRTCDALWNEESIELERRVHGVIRTNAPDTHIVMFSFGETPTAAAFEANVGELSDLIEWRNASVGFHAHDECAPIGEISDFSRDLPDGRRIALLVTELPPNDWQANTHALETAGIGWMHYHWVEVDSDLETFRSAHDEAGVSWCPDFGTWPMDSSTCDDGR
jgi:hypothetical protein